MGTSEQGNAEVEYEQEVECYEEIIEEIDDNEEPIDNILHETVEQTAERSKLEAKEATESGTEENPVDGAINPQQGAAKPNDKLEKPNQQLIAAPERFTAEAKDAWSKAPRALQEQYKKTVDDLEAGQRAKLHQINSIKAEAEGVLEGVRPWVKDWASNGISASQGVALLAKTHEKMVENPAKTLAELARDNNTTAEEIQAYMEGRVPEGQQSARSGNGHSVDLDNHPKIKYLTETVQQYENEKREAVVRTETQKIAALRDEVDASGNKPFGEILNQDFLRYAHPLVELMRSPPKDANGQFTQGEVPTLLDAYKRAYRIWLSEPGNSSLSQAASQPNQAQPQQQRTQAQPISMRSRAVQPGRTPMSQSDPSKFLHESVEDTMRRLASQNWQA